jgi:hypothetical protein
MIHGHDHRLMSMTQNKPESTSIYEFRDAIGRFNDQRPIGLVYNFLFETGF